MDIKRQINRFMIISNAYINSIKHNKPKRNVNKKILIIFQQIFGDAVVFSSALNAYAELYSQTEGYRITFIARPSVVSFMKAVVPLNKDIDIQEVDFKRFVEDYKYYQKVIEKYRNYADLLIVSGTSLSAEIMSASCNANRKVGLVRSIPIRSPLIMAVFYRIAYSETVVPAKEDMMLQRHRQLLNYLGLKDYKAKLPVLLPKSKIIDEDKYAVCCPGASKLEKCWPTDRYISIIDYITEKYNINVHLCGGQDELKFEEIILKGSKNKKHIVSHIGKTNFSDWSAIVQHACLVLGNDSATMHLAAAGRVPSICISGVYDKFLFYPYQVDELEKGDFLPTTLYKDMSCEWCRTVGYNAGYGNKDCQKRIKHNGCTCCIEAVSIEDVQKEIDLLI